MRAERESDFSIVFYCRCMLLSAWWVREGSTHPAPPALISADQRVRSRFQPFFLENAAGRVVQRDVRQWVRARKQEEDAEAV